MSGVAPTTIAEHAVSRYRSGATTFPYFVQELEQAVSVTEDAEMRRVWGQLEIINALTLDEEVEVDQPDEEIDELIHQFLEATRLWETRREGLA
jgi:hypothetical protein